MGLFFHREHYEKGAGRLVREEYEVLRNRMSPSRGRRIARLSCLLLWWGKSEGGDSTPESLEQAALTRWFVKPYCSTRWERRMSQG